MLQVWLVLPRYACVPYEYTAENICAELCTVVVELIMLLYTWYFGT